MTCLPVAHSVPTIASISALIAETYDVGPIRQCRFLTRGLNDTYGLVGETARYVLRCYRAGWRRPDDIAYELDVLLHLARKGVPVAVPIARRDGGYVGHVELPEGPRAVVLFTYAEGYVRRTVEASRRYASALARIHNATDDFASTAQRFRLDLGHLLDEPLGAILPLLADRPTDRDYLVELADRLRRESELVCPQLSTGFCHGDASGDNAHLTSAAVTFFDFDCGGQGWRSDDLAVFFYGRALQDEPDRAAHCAAFIEGYEAQRRVPTMDFEAIPLFVLLRQIWHMGLHAAGSENWGSGWIDDAYFDGRFANLRRWEESRLCELLPERR